MMTFAEWVQTQQTEKWQLDQATVDMLIDYFYDREICDDDRMDRYFNRTLNICRDRYKNLLRVETIEFDPLVSKYFEAEYTTKRDGNTNRTKNVTGTIQHKLGEQNITVDNSTTTNRLDGEANSSSDFNRTNSEKITDEGSGSRHGNSSNTSYSNSLTDSNNNINTTDSNTSNTSGTDNQSKSTGNITRRADKAAPMNASGITIGKETGKLGGLDFEYASAYAQNDSDTTEKSTGNNVSNTTNSGTSNSIENGKTNTTNNINGSSSDSESSTNNNTRTGTYGENSHDESGNNYNETNVEDMQGSKTYTRSGINTDENVGQETVFGNDTGNELRRERYAGRDGILPQEAMQKATNYLMNYSTAFQWLCNKLEINFIGIYDI